MRIILFLLVLFFCAGNSHAGVLKWASRGAAVCALNSACSGAVSKGLAKGTYKLGAFLAARYSQKAVKSCLASPKCVGLATGAAGFASGTTLGLGAQASLEAWMSDNGFSTEGSSPSNENTQASTAGGFPQDEEPPEGDDEEPKIKDKLDYLFGKASGREHNIKRSAAMYKDLQRIGLNDTPSSRQLITRKIIEAYNDPSSVSKVDGKFVTREMFVMGPKGGVRIDTVWIKNDLISFVVKGGLK